MRFTRYPRGIETKASPQRIAAARRAVQKDFDRFPLFPEFVRHKTVEERLEAVAIARNDFLRDRRDYLAGQWRKARAALAALPTSKRLAVTRWWQRGIYPGSPEYLLGSICDATRGVCFWHKLAHLRRLELVREGKLPRPAKWNFD